MTEIIIKRNYSGWIGRIPSQDDLSRQLFGDVWLPLPFTADATANRVAAFYRHAPYYYTVVVAH